MSNMKKGLFIFVMTSALLLLGCTTTIQHDEAVATTPARIESGQKIYIAMAMDGAYGDKVFRGSGTQVSHYISACIRPKAADIVLATTHEPYEQALTNAQAHSARYAVYPIITNWEQRAAAWSGRPTRVSMTILIHDIQAEKQILAHKIDVTGRSATFVSQSADGLAETSIREFCGKVFN